MPELTAEHAQRNAGLVEGLRGKLILAPLTRGGNLPFRRLCADFGAEVTMSEMAFARALLKGDSAKEKAILRRASNEALYGERRRRCRCATLRPPDGLRARLWLSGCLSA